MCPDQTTASCLGGIVLYGSSKAASSSKVESEDRQFESTSTSTVISRTLVAITTVTPTPTSRTSDMNRVLLQGRTWGIIGGIWIGALVMDRLGFVIV